MIFNVDLLHPGRGDVTPEVFVDHFELDFCETHDLRNSVRMMSIVMPSSALVFDGYWSPRAVAGSLPSALQTELRVPLLTEPGLAISKCQSVKSVRRDRDSFDLFLTFVQPNAEGTRQTLAEARVKYYWLAQLLDDLAKYVHQESEESDRRVRRFLPQGSSYVSDGSSPSELGLKALSGMPSV